MTQKATNRLPAEQQQASDVSVTLGLTCYNAADTITRALVAACQIQGPVTEILVVDDASSDGSAACVERLAEQDPRIRLIRQSPNGGVGQSRQRLVEEAQGTFLAFLDDDDLSLPHRILDQLEAIQRAQEASGTELIACYASGERHYPNDYVKPLPAIGSQGAPLQGADVAAYLLYFAKKPELFYGAGTPTCSLCARVSTLRAVGSFDPNFRRLEDVDFAIRLALAGGLFVGTQAIGFQQFASQGADKAPEKNVAAERALADKHQAFLKAKGLYFYAHTWPYLRYYHFTRQYPRLLVTLAVLLLRYPLRTTRHFMKTAPKRLLHEAKMRAKKASKV